MVVPSELGSAGSLREHRVLVVLDGAPDACGSLDGLPVLGSLPRGAARTTTPTGLEPGSETGLPTLLGAALTAPIARGRLEAAAAGIALAAGEDAWRIDLRHADGTRCDDAETRAHLPALQELLPDHRLIALRGHRLLAVGTTRPGALWLDGVDVHVWPGGATLPRLLDARTALVCGGGAAAGIGRLLGAHVVVPDGCTGDVDTDLRAKLDAVLALAPGHDQVVVHVGGADEAAHRLDARGKRTFLERVDADLLAPLAARAAIDLTVTADHSTDPRTGRHGAEPVPAWHRPAGARAVLEARA